MILFFLSLFCWQQSLHLPSCVIRGFCLLSNAEMEDRRYCTGKKNWRFFGFLGETEEVFDVGEFSWRQITHFDILRTISAFKKKNAGKKRQYKHHIRSYKHTNIHTYTLSKSSFELPPSWKICRDFCLWIFVFHTAEFLKVAIFLMTNERKPVLLDFQRKIN